MNVRNPPHPQKMKTIPRKQVVFRSRRAKDSSNVFDFTGPPSGVNRSAAPDINAESSPLSIFMLFFRQIFQLILEETNRYFHQYTASKNTVSTSVQSPDTQVFLVFLGPRRKCCDGSHFSSKLPLHASHVALPN